MIRDILVSIIVVTVLLCGTALVLNEKTIQAACMVCMTFAAVSGSKSRIIR